MPRDHLAEAIDVLRMAVGSPLEVRISQLQAKALLERVEPKPVTLVDTELTAADVLFGGFREGA